MIKDEVLIKNEKLLQKYNGIWNKVSSSIKKQLDSQLIYNKRFSEKKKTKLTGMALQIFFMIKKSLNQALIILDYQ